VASGLLLACGLGIFYSIVVRHAVAEDNSVLADKMFALSADLRENGPENLGEELTARRAGQHTPYWIRILDAQGRVIAETPQMDRMIPSQIFPTGREPADAIRSRKDYRSAGKLFSLVAFNEHSAGQAYTLQLARLTHFNWHKTAQATSKLKGISHSYSSPSSSAVLWPRL